MILQVLLILEMVKNLFHISLKKINEKDIIDLLKDENADYSNMLINVGISSALTGLSRIYMSFFKNNPLFRLYYSDTDSVFLYISLEILFPYLVGKELGQLKPEYEFKEAVFLAAKVYGGITQGGDSIVKAKGVKNLIPFDNLKTLLQKQNKLIIPTEN